jgi:hypothetical protein
LLVRSDEARNSLLNCLRILCVVKLSDAFLESLGLKEAKREVDMQFSVPDAIDEATGQMQLVTVTFLRRPIGLKFRRDPSSASLVVSGVAPGSHAQELGIKESWIIKSIASKEMSGLPMQECNRLIKTHVSRLLEKSVSAPGAAPEAKAAGSISSLMAKVYKYE